MQSRLLIDKAHTVLDTGHIPICAHGPNLHVPKHIGRPMSGLFLETASTSELVNGLN